MKERKIKTVVFVGRGSSDHANLVGRYLFETKCSMVASICAPSVVTAYHSNVDYSNVLMIAVSQSGGARDIYEVMKHCDEQGGVCVCVTNVEGSLMTQAGKYQVRNHCGPERSVTAGKSYLTQVTIVTALAAYISGIRNSCLYWTSWAPSWSGRSPFWSPRCAMWSVTTGIRSTCF